jgi:hypothetical protein
MTDPIEDDKMLQIFKVDAESIFVFNKQPSLKTEEM